MPEAILRGVEVLDEFGKVGNDRLIVLVSDGKSWAPKGAEFTGEVVMSKDDPVSMVDHLHRTRGVRFHAVGISNMTLYQSWCARRSQQYVDNLAPNHPLLEEIVRAGGGDPSAIGGVDVLVDYFSGLGAGLRRYVGTPRQERSEVHLSQDTIGAARAASKVGRNLVDNRSADLSRLKDGIERLNVQCKQLAGRQLGSWEPFLSLVSPTAERAFLAEIRDATGLTAPVTRLWKIMTEKGPGRRRKTSDTPPSELEPIFAAFEGFIGRLNPLRNYVDHDQEDGSTDNQKRLEKVSQILQHYISRRTLDPLDAESCMSLWCRILADAADATEAANTILSGIASCDTTRAIAIPGADEAKPDFDAVFDLRIRD
jgi:hypothetical protein